ncbi:MAG: glucose-1-phosphate adenylyltransferase [Candidatus Omnitrophica bacterium CG07_land_8_20_14_0_80_42_15]|uniref:Glucose-1-phosphate adenylyltransferase n=1 Tax=Candidatus Aquitaenariimonas noxiae TaxID=1974741 RepID=A0A2J0KR92_9BACT|nr:MAG: glucose-1-phosphate adenylyltransferase [Candidatus Omnitrophica bacterium CG07_land_8_20_14_0_80_42_15]
MPRISTFVMAGGKGERIYPLTKDRTKPAVPFGGIYRIIDFTLSNCINSGIRKIHVLTQYKSLSLSRHIRMGWNIFDAELDEFIDFIPAQQWISEQWYQGTADCIYQNLDTVEVENPDFILILAGDHIYKMDYMKMLEFHISKGADATVGIIEVEKEKSPNLGVAELGADGRIKAFAEKPQHPITIPGNPDHIYASMGIYVFSRKVLEAELKEDSGRENSSHDFSKDIIPSMLNKRLKIYPFNLKNGDKSGTCYWRDIGNLDAYYEANMDLIRVTPVFNMYDKDWSIRTYQEHFPPAKTVFSQSQEEGGRRGMALDSIVSSGCIISGGLVQRSVLSPNVRVNSFAEVYDSVIMEGVNIGRYAKIKGAIIDKDVNIPQETVIGFDPEEDKKKYVISDKGIVIIPKGTVIK